MGNLDPSFIPSHPHFTQLPQVKSPLKEIQTEKKISPEEPSPETQTTPPPLSETKSMDVALSIRSGSPSSVDTSKMKENEHLSKMLESGEQILKEASIQKDNPATSGAPLPHLAAETPTKNKPSPIVKQEKFLQDSPLPDVWAPGSFGVLAMPFSTAELLLIKEKYEAVSKELDSTKKELSDHMNLPSSPEHDQKIEILQKKIEKLTKKNAKLKEKIINSAVGLTGTTVQAGGSITSVISLTKELISRSGGSSPVLLAAGSLGYSGASAINTAAGTAMLVRDGREYLEVNKQLNEKQEKLNALKKAPEDKQDPKEMTILETEIKELTEKEKILVEKLQQGCANTSLAAISTYSATAQFIMSEAAHLSSTATSVLGATSSLGLATTGVATMAISANAIANNVKTGSKISQEVDRLNRMHTDNPILQEIIDLKNKNLEFQAQNNIVGAITNGLTFATGALGTTASIIATIGVTTSAAAVASTTAGIGGLALGGAALAVGAGYIVYKNRHYLSNVAQDKVASLNALRLAAQIKVTDATKNSLQKKVEELRYRVHEGQNVKKEEMDKVFSELVNKIEESILAKEEAAKTSTNPLEQNKLYSEIRSLELEIKKLATEKVNLALKRAKGQVKDTKTLMTQRGKVDQLKSSIVTLAEQKKKAEEKKAQLKESLENYQISDRLIDYSPEEVARFKEHLIENLHDKKNATEIYEFLEKEGVEIKGDLKNAILNYLIQPVSS